MASTPSKNFDNNLDDLEFDLSSTEGLNLLENLGFDLSLIDLNSILGQNKSDVNLMHGQNTDEKNGNQDTTLRPESTKNESGSEERKDCLDLLTVGYRADMADWDNNRPVEKDISALMRKYGMASKSEQEPYRTERINVKGSEGRCFTVICNPRHCKTSSLNYTQSLASGSNYSTGASALKDTKSNRDNLIGMPYLTSSNELQELYQDLDLDLGLLLSSVRKEPNKNNHENFIGGPLEAWSAGLKSALDLVLQQSSKPKESNENSAKRGRRPPEA